MEDRGAVFSSCETYRYVLWRIWDSARPAALFVCLNPSTADASRDDPTVRRCRNFARDWGHGGFYLCNLFAYRARDPKEMLWAIDPIGPENDAWLVKMTEASATVVAAWGALGKHRGRDRSVLALCDSWRCLAIGKTGQPRHPLYLKNDCIAVPYVPFGLA